MVSRTEFKDHPVALVGTVDCTGVPGLPLCRKHNVDVYPTIKYDTLPCLPVPRLSHFLSSLLGPRTVRPFSLFFVFLPRWGDPHGNLELYDNEKSYYFLHQFVRKHVSNPTCGLSPQAILMEFTTSSSWRSALLFTSTAVGNVCRPRSPRSLQRGTEVADPAIPGLRRRLGFYQLNGIYLSRLNPSIRNQSPAPPPLPMPPPPSPHTHRRCCCTRDCQAWNTEELNANINFRVKKIRKARLDSLCFLDPVVCCSSSLRSLLLSLSSSFLLPPASRYHLSVAPFSFLFGLLPFVSLFLQSQIICADGRAARMIVLRTCSWRINSRKR